jgi:hypothetical protein
MAGRGMGAATKGGGCVEKGAKNRMVSETSKTTGPISWLTAVADKGRGKPIRGPGRASSKWTRYGNGQGL